MKAVIKYAIGAAVIGVLATGIYFKVFIPKHTFSIIQPTKGDFPVSIQGIGNVGALNIYAITAQTGGRILAIHTDVGQWIKKGDLLVEVDGVDLPQQLEVVKANTVKAEYEVKALQAELKNQQAQKVLLQTTYNRYKKLSKKGLVAQAEFDKAQADLQGINAAITATRSRIDSAQSAVVVAAKNVDALQEKINRLTIHAPADGYVISREAEVAQYVQPATPVLKIVDPKNLWVETKFDERISGQIKLDQQAEIRLRSRPGTPFQGKVQRIDAMTDPVTLERKINVSFATIPKPFFINEQAQVRIAIRAYKDVVKVPLSVVVQKQGQKGVWTLSSGRAHFLPIDLLATNNTEAAIKKGDTSLSVIVPNAKNKSLSEGMRIIQ
jgi:RND family efflux transporter MFP subunit